MRDHADAEAIQEEEEQLLVSSISEPCPSIQAATMAQSGFNSPPSQPTYVSNVAAANLDKKIADQKAQIPIP